MSKSFPFATDIRSVTRTRNDQQKSLDRRPNAPYNTFKLINESGRPNTESGVDKSTDPVSSIPMQNPLAQPGGGKCFIQQPSPILSQLFGVYSKVTDKQKPFIYNEMPNPKTIHTWLTSETLPSPEIIQEQYFNGGARPDGTSFYIESNGPIKFQPREKRRNERRMREYDQMVSGASVVKNDTSITPQHYPINSGTIKKHGFTMPHKPTKTDSSATYPRNNTKFHRNKLLFKNS